MSRLDEPLTPDASTLETLARVVCFNWFVVGLVCGIALMGAVTVVVLM